MVHELKTHPTYFQEVRKGIKTFEVRKYDRDYRLGDTLVLKEWLDEYTGQEEIVRVTYMLRDWQYVKEGYIIMGIEKAVKTE